MAQLEDAFIAPPRPMDGFLYVAREMHNGAEALWNTSAGSAFAVTHLSGHSVETALKAALSKCGVPAEELSQPKLGHNLESLWSRAVEEGVPVSSISPDWIAQLNRVHSKPYSLRYPINFHAIVLPNQAAMVSGSTELLKTIEAFCNGT